MNFDEIKETCDFAVIPLDNIVEFEQEYHDAVHEDDNRARLTVKPDPKTGNMIVFVKAQDLASLYTPEGKQ